MIEIFCLIFSVWLFVLSAKNRQKNKILWGFIAVASYYIPIIIFGLLIYPSITYGWVNNDNQTTFQLIGIALKLFIGISSVLIIKRILDNTDSTKQKQIIRRTFLLFGGLIGTFIVIIVLLTYLKMRMGVTLPGRENTAGVQKMENKQYEEAILDFTKALVRHPNKSIIFLNRGKAYEFSKQYEKAIVDFTKSIDNNNFTDKTQLINAYFERANSYGAIKEIDLMLKDYEFALQLDTTNDRIRIEVAYSRKYLGNLKGCCEELEKIKKLSDEFKITYDQLKLEYNKCNDSIDLIK